MGMSAPKILQEPICDQRRFGRILNSDHSGRSLRVLLFPRHSGARRVSFLSELTVGESGVLVSLNLPENVQNHLMHMGFVPNALVTALRRAPAGDPTVYSIDGMEIALRHETAEAIRVRPAELSEESSADTAIDAQNDSAAETAPLESASQFAEASK
jgi:Fe2+ transport system protein FeoA